MSLALNANSLIKCSSLVVPTPMPFNIPMSNVRIQSQFAATNIMSTPLNIPSLGMCMSPTNPSVIAAYGNPVPCTPILLAWTLNSLSVRINGCFALTDQSQIMCTLGGIISIEKTLNQSVKIGK